MVAREHNMPHLKNFTNLLDLKAPKKKGKKKKPAKKSGAAKVRPVNKEQVSVAEASVNVLNEVIDLTMDDDEEHLLTEEATHEPPQTAGSHEPDQTASHGTKVTRSARSRVKSKKALENLETEILIGNVDSAIHEPRRKHRRSAAAKRKPVIVNQDQIDPTEMEPAETSQSFEEGYSTFYGESSDETTVFPNENSLIEHVTAKRGVTEGSSKAEQALPHSAAKTAPKRKNKRKIADSVVSSSTPKKAKMVAVTSQAKLAAEQAPRASDEVAQDSISGVSRMSAEEDVVENSIVEESVESPAVDVQENNAEGDNDVSPAVDVTTQGEEFVTQADARPEVQEVNAANENEVRPVVDGSHVSQSSDNSIERGRVIKREVQLLRIIADLTEALKRATEREACFQETIAALTEKQRQAKQRNESEATGSSLIRFVVFLYYLGQFF